MGGLKSIVFICLFGLAFCAPNGFESAESKCLASQKCKLPNCKCFGTGAPNNLNISTIPQLVYLTFDDSVQDFNHKLVNQLISGYLNPDGCSISATFFVSHEYTDYSKVNDYYIKGHEIALRSITSQTPVDLWRSADADLLKREFDGERQLIGHFAFVDQKLIKGIRMPFLQLAGDEQFKMMEQNNFKYDATWTTVKYMDPPLWPYTLDFGSDQDCIILPCPKKSYPGRWIVPIVDWSDTVGRICNNVDSCNTGNTLEEKINFFKHNFQMHYTTNKAPFGLHLRYGWLSDKTNFKAVQEFLYYLKNLSDVHIVSIDRMLKWIENPTDNAKNPWSSCQKRFSPNCEPKSCNLPKEEEERYLVSCVTKCPNQYPWLDNPLGN